MLSNSPNSGSSSIRGNNSTTTATAVTNPHNPFHSLPSDCQHLILHYHIFHLEIYSKFIREIICDTDPDYSEETRARDLRDSSPPVAGDDESIITENSPEWNFLQKFAHSINFSAVDVNMEEYEGDTMDLPINHFLHRCRHRKHKEAFHYLDLSDLNTNLMPELLRCVPKLDIIWKAEGWIWGRLCMDPRPWLLTSILENVRRIERLDLSFDDFSIDASCFQSLRGVKELSLFRYVERDTDAIQKVVENFRGLKRLTLKQCDFPCIDLLLSNLKGIQDLDISSLGTSPLQLKDFRNLRGIRKLCLRSIWAHDGSQAFTDEIVQQLRGIEELSVEYIHIEQLTDQAFENLRGIRKLSLKDGISNKIVTDAAFVNLRGIESLSIGYFDLITNAIFEQLRGIKELSIESCPNIQFTADALRNLRGIRSLSWFAFRNTPIHLNDECMKQLCSLEKLQVGRAVITFDVEAFRHLKHVTDLCIRGPGKKHPTLSAPLTDALFSHLKSVRKVKLYNLKAEIQDFRRLFREHMPQLSSFNMYRCHVLKSSLESIWEREGFIEVRYDVAKSQNGWVVGGFEYRSKVA